MFHVVVLLLAIATASAYADTWSWGIPRATPEVAEATPEVAPAAAPDTYAAALEKSRRLGVPLVGMVGADWCTPCQRMERTLQHWKTRADIAYVKIDIEHPMARVVMQGQADTIPHLAVTTGGGTPERPAFGFHVKGEQTAAEAARRLRIPANPPPLTTERRAAARGPWLSVNGSEPTARHHVTVRGPPWTVSPNTDQHWRRHVAEEHGNAAAWTMTPEQLAQAHADAHNAPRRAGRRGGIF